MNDSKKTTEQEDLEARRKAIRQILVGSGVILSSQVLPNTWTKPIMDSVMPPARAGETFRRCCQTTSRGLQDLRIRLVRLGYRVHRVHPTG